MKIASRLKLTAIVLALGVMAYLQGCQDPTTIRSVIVYTSVDQLFSEPVLREFQEKTGIKVLPVYDVEATKTTGLVNRLIAEKSNPQADVFWNGEFAQTIVLKEENVLAPYKSPNRAEVPVQFRDPQGYWTGFAGRARVIIVNTSVLPSSKRPKSVFDLLNSNWPADKVGIAYPLFGTTATHAAALYSALGPDEAKTYFENLNERGVRVLAGNSMVRDYVASGQLVVGLTDTDDACGALKKGAPVEVIFPDQDENSLGTFVIPNTVAMIANGPNPEEAKELIDFLLSKETGRLLVESGWSHVPLRSLGVKPSCFAAHDIRPMTVSLDKVYSQMKLSRKELSEIFIR